MSNKLKWGIFIVLLLALLGGVLYYILNKKYYPKVKDVAYINLELANDTAQVKAGIKILNRVPLPIGIDSVYYVIKEDSIRLGWGQMTVPHTLPPLGSKVVDFKMLLDFEKYRQHIKDRQDKDSIRLDVDMDIFFNLPLIPPQEITLNRHLTVPVPKSPSIKLQDIEVRSFSVDSGYSLLLTINAGNQHLPNLRIENFNYNIRIGDSLIIDGMIDSTFHLQKGQQLLQVPLTLETSDVIALLKKKLSGDKNWHYDAQLEALIRSDHKLLDEFRLTVEKEGTVDISKMGGDTQYRPSVKQIKQLEITSTEKQTILQAAVVLHNPAPIPFYIDSATYYIRHKGKIIASGKKDFEKVLPKTGDQLFNIRLVVDESAYQEFMKDMQGKQKAALNLELNLLYNLPDSERQKLTLKRQIQVPVAGQGSVKVVGLTLEELDPEKGAYLNLKLQVQSSNLPDLTISDLDYRLQLGEDLQLTGHTEEPIVVGDGNGLVEVPIHLSAEDINQLFKKALKGTLNWQYDLQANATLKSSNKILGPTTVALDFSGELEMGKGMGGKSLMPKITKVDSLLVTVRYDSAWVDLHLQVENPLPVDLKIDSLGLVITHQQDTFAIVQEEIAKVVPAKDSQSAWITLTLNYNKWLNFIEQHQDQDSLRLMEAFTLVYSIGDLGMKRVSFDNKLTVPMPDAPVAKFRKTKLKGISLHGVVLSGIIDVRNSNVRNITVNDISYNVCVENLLDACGTINRTYKIGQGNSIVKVPLTLGIGEVFRALFAKLSGNKKKRNIYLNTTATISTESPKLQDTYLKLEIWQKKALFQKQKNQKQDKK